MGVAGERGNLLRSPVTPLGSRVVKEGGVGGGAEGGRWVHRLLLPLQTADGVAAAV